MCDALKFSRNKCLKYLYIQNLSFQIVSQIDTHHTFIIYFIKTAEAIIGLKNCKSLDSKIRLSICTEETVEPLPLAKTEHLPENTLRIEHVVLHPRGRRSVFPALLPTACPADGGPHAGAGVG